MTPTEILLSVLVLVQFAVIYGLVNRLLVQAGQPRMRPGAAAGWVAESIKPSPSKEPVEHPKPPVIERIKVGV